MDAIWVLLAACIFLLPFVLAHLWYWVGLWATIIVVLAAWEGIALLRTKKTLSQQMWAYGKQHKGRRLGLLVSMGAVWLALILHLGWK